MALTAAAARGVRPQRGTTAVGGDDVNELLWILLGCGIGAVAALASAAGWRWRELGGRLRQQRDVGLPPLADVDAPFFAVRLRRSGSLIEASVSLQAILGRTEAELPVRLIDAMPAEDADRLDDAIDDLLRHGGVRTLDLHLIGQRLERHPVVLALHTAHAPLRPGASETRVIEALGVDLAQTLDTAERYRLLFEAAPDAMLLVDAQGSVRMANRAAETLLGWRAEELQRMAVDALVPTRVRDLHDRQREAYFAAPGAKIPKTRGFGDAGDLVAVHRDGQEIPVEIALSPLQVGRDALVAAAIRDIRERRRAAEALQESERRLRTLANHLPGVAYRCALDADRTVFYVSDGVFALTGRLAGEFIESGGPGLRSLVHPADREAVDAAIQRQVKAGQHFEVEYRLEGRDRTCHVWERGVAIRTESGSVAWLDGVILDISDRKAAERELERARAEAVAASRAKSEFLANMSHEIRTPLNAVLGFAEILASMVSDRRQRHYLDGIQTSGRALLQLINDILDLSKVEAGKLELRPAPVDVRRLLEEVRAIFDQKAGERRVRIEIDEQGPPTGVLVLDEGRLRQVLVNLVGNAVKFTEGGTVTMALRSVLREDGRVDLEIAVRDTGVGIPEADLARIFDAFEQRQGHDDIRFGGSGLGLAITRRLVEMMGGKIEVSSEVGVGSDFHFVLHGLERGVAGDPVAESVAAEAMRFEPARVLIVDDVAANRAVLRAFLDPTGLTVEEVGSGEAAIAAVERALPDLVLMDLRMPKMDGFEASRAIRALPGGDAPTLLAVTAAVTSGREQEVEALFAEVLHKPITRDALLAALQRHLRWELREQVATVDPARISSGDWSQAVSQPGIGELLQWLEAQRERAEELRATRAIDGMSSFATEVLEQAKRFGVERLETFAQRLEESVTLFDLDAMDAAMRRWPDLVHELHQEVDAIITPPGDRAAEGAKS